MMKLSHHKTLSSYVLSGALLLVLNCSASKPTQIRAERTSTPEELEFRAIDTYAVETPLEKEASLRTLALHLTEPFASDRAKARSITRWMADRIDYDWESYKSGRYASISTDATFVLKRRISVCDGYANLFVELTKLAGLESVKVTGFSKGYGYNPYKNPKTSDHSWNAVKIDGEWRLLDVTWTSGEREEKSSDKRFNDFYFLTPPEQFINDHLPDDKKWQLLDHSISKQEFQKRVKKDSHFFSLGLKNLTPDVQLLKANDSLTISLKGPSNLNFLVEMNNFPNTYFVEDLGTFYNIHILSPRRGNYDLKMYAKHKSDPGMLPQILTYQVHFNGGHRDSQFAKVYPGTHTIREPIARFLSAYETYDFLLNVPGASEIAFISSDGKWKRYQSKASGEYYIRESFPPGRLTINANYGMKSWPTLAEYELR